MHHPTILSRSLTASPRVVLFVRDWVDQHDMASVRKQLQGYGTAYRHASLRRLHRAQDREYPRFESLGLPLVRSGIDREMHGRIRMPRDDVGERAPGLRAIAVQAADQGTVRLPVLLKQAQSLGLRSSHVDPLR
jgi:hypothetical protein